MQRGSAVRRGALIRAVFSLVSFISVSANKLLHVSLIIQAPAPPIGPSSPPGVANSGAGLLRDVKDRLASITSPLPSYFPLPLPFFFFFSWDQPMQVIHHLIPLSPVFSSILMSCCSVELRSCAPPTPPC